MRIRKCKCNESYEVIYMPRAHSTFFGQSCSFGWSSCLYVVHFTKEIKRYSEHFFPVLISNTGLNIWKSSYSLFTSSSELQTEQPWRKVWIVCEGSLRTDLSPGQENTIFQIYVMMICSPMLLIYRSRYFGQRRRLLPPSAFTFPTSSFHVLLETQSSVFNQTW